MKKFMKSLLLVSVALCAFACGKEGGEGPDTPKPVPPTPEEGKVTLSFAAKAMSRAAGDALSTEEESAINNVWVLQFDKNTDDGKLVVAEYFEGEGITTSDKGEKSVSVALEDAEKPRIYCVVNVGKAELEDLKKDLEAKKSLALKNFVPTKLQIEENTSEQIPMIGYTEENTATGTAVVELKRMIAKIAYTCVVDVPVGHKFTPTRVQLCNVANVAAYTEMTTPEAQTGLFPEASTDNFFNYKEDTNLTIAENADKKDSFAKTWYLPENLRGVVATLNSATQKGKENAPEFATCIEVSGDYEMDGKITDVTYRVYPGANAENDFNIVRNHAYTITVTVEGCNPNDIRVEIEKGVEAGEYTDDNTWE
ncbi:MAG: DUF4906 domain-containing protein [Alistipes sp.]|nr:DUF4906 domain-containing protein [Alistipes sp.]